MAETLSDIMGIKDPFAQNVLKAIEAKGEVEAAEKQEKAYGQQEMAKAEAATTEQFAKEREPTELKQKYEKTIDELGQPFIPTQQTAGDLGNIFAMTNILGFLIGGGAKGSAQAALSAQNGMLEGYQKGQQDVYKKQKDIFDENQKSLSKAVEGLRDELKRAADTASVNKELGLAQARQAIANHQAKQMGEYLDKMGVAATYELSEKAWQINEKLKAEKRAEEDRAERLSIEQQRFTLEKENKLLGLEAKYRDKILPLTQGVRSIENLQKQLSDPEVKAGLTTKLDSLIQKIRSLDGKQDFETAVNNTLTSNDKTTLFLKDALLEQYTIERAAKNGQRLTVQDVKIAGPVLDPTNYKPETYMALLDSRRRNLYNNLGDLGVPPEKVKELSAQRPYTPYQSKPTQTSTYTGPRATIGEINLIVKDGKWVNEQTGEEVK